MWLEIIPSMLLLAITLELGWIIFKTVNSVAESRKNLSDAIERLTQAQGIWIEITRDLAEKLVNTRNSQDPSPARDKTAIGQIEVQIAELLSVLQGLSVSISMLKNSQASSSAEITDRIADLLDQTCSRIDKSIMQATAELTNDRQQFLRGLINQSNHQKEESRALTSLLLDALSEVRSPAKGLTSGQPIADDRLSTMSSRESATQPTVTQRSANNHTTSHSRASDHSSVLKPPSVSDDSASGNLEFAKLQSWVTANLPQIMNRSLNQWNKPQDLFGDVPSELEYTARMLDPDSKLVLVGVAGTSKHLALALPGGFLDPRYYEWFNLPKGIGARVERTMAPAIVDATDLGFRMLQRGVITQD